MSELWAAVRDSIGIDSKVNYQEKPTLIKDLPSGLYELYNKGQLIKEKSIGPNQIPGTLMNYCIELEEEQTLKGTTLTEIVTNLDIHVKKVE